MTNTCNIYLGIEPKNKKREKRYGNVKRRIENPVKHLRERAFCENSEGLSAVLVFRT